MITLKRDASPAQGRGRDHLTLSQALAPLTTVNFAREQLRYAYS